MNRNEAYNILGLDSSATEEDVNKAFRKLAAQYHPDRNKDENAEAEFKKINEAAQILKKPEEEFNPFFNVPSWANSVNFHVNRRRRNSPPPTVYVNFSFEESVLGCKKEIEFTRDARCNACQGRGDILTNDKCPACNGKGNTSQHQNTNSGHFKFIMTCPQCSGSGKKADPCSTCSGTGATPETVKHKINIPGGIHNQETIRLPQAGHYNSGFVSDAFIIANVEPDKDMSLSPNGRDVLSNIELSLLEALKGTKKKVRTVKGELTLNIRPGTKNENIIKASGYGSRGLGDHLFTIKVNYPEDIDKLVDFLENEEK